MKRGPLAKTLVSASGAAVAGIAGSVIAVMGSKQVQKAVEIDNQVEIQGAEILQSFVNIMADRMVQLEGELPTYQTRPENDALKGRDEKQKFFAENELPPTDSRQKALQS